MTGWEFAAVINKLGVVPLLIFLIIVFIILLKDIKKEGQANRESLSSVQKSIKNDFEALEKRQAKRDAIQDEAICKLEDRVREVEVNKVEKADIQEAVAGWRTETGKISDRIDQLILEMTKIWQ